MQTDSGVKSIDEYIATYPDSTQVILNKIRKIVREVAPEATEKMSYGIPTFWYGRNFMHFGGYSKHIGFYPGTSTVIAFKDQLTEYETSKGTVRFPLDKPIPYELIRSITEYNISSLK
jgi:uncharacterized protein YdhG (YjbR/CyaY superfamily)